MNDPVVVMYIILIVFGIGINLIIPSLKGKRR